MTLIVIPGEPVSKARARVFFNKKANRIMAITPTKTASYEQYIKLLAADYFTAPSLEPIVMTVRVYRGIPKSLSKKLIPEAEAGRIRPSSRPDADNYLKSCLDALNGIAFKDDSQVVSVHVHKFYSSTPRTEIEISELNDPEGRLPPPPGVPE
jgi:Holliday junction resolvase RusA-like endonuclease